MAYRKTVRYRTGIEMAAIGQLLTKHAKEWGPLQSGRRFVNGYLPLGESRFIEL